MCRQEKNNGQCKNCKYKRQKKKKTPFCRKILRVLHFADYLFLVFCFKKVFFKFLLQINFHNFLFKQQNSNKDHETTYEICKILIAGEP